MAWAFWRVLVVGILAALLGWIGPTGLRARATRLSITARAMAKIVVLLLKVYPMLPSGPLDWVTPRPVVERFGYPTSLGQAEGDLYRPDSRGPHPAVVVCLGVVPFGVDHPQVPRLGDALARSGFAALLYWSPAMREFRLDPTDVADIASAYDHPLARPDIDVARSGLLPGYAPDLNPDEGIWAYLKYVELRNVCCTDLDDLHQQLRSVTARLRHKPHVLRGCVAHCGYAL